MFAFSFAFVRCERALGLCDADAQNLDTRPINVSINAVADPDARCEAGAFNSQSTTMEFSHRCACAHRPTYVCVYTSVSFP